MSTIARSISRQTGLVRRGILSSFPAPSGSGKRRCANRSHGQCAGIGGIPFPTRPVSRGRGSRWQDYRDFLDEASFRQMIDRNEFVEWAHVYGNLYGTPRKELTEKKWSRGIDVLLSKSMCKVPVGEKKFEDGVYIFIPPPPRSIRYAPGSKTGRRLAEEIQRRLQKAKEEVWSYREYYYIVRK